MDMSAWSPRRILARIYRAINAPLYRRIEVLERDRERIHATDAQQNEGIHQLQDAMVQELEGQRQLAESQAQEAARLRQLEAGLSQSREDHGLLYRAIEDLQSQLQQASGSRPAPQEAPAAAAGAAGAGLQIPEGAGVPIPCYAGTQPREFEFQDPAVFLLDGKDLEGVGENDRARFITESLNRERYRFFATAIEYLQVAGVRGDYHEYGCYSGTTFRMVLTEARKANLSDMKFFAFDSFAGLPEVSSDVSPHCAWARGTMAMDEEAFWGLIRRHGVFVDRVETVKGYFSDVLTPALQERFLEREARIALLNIDCDLYESAVPVFKFCEPLLQDGTLIYLDDYYAGYRGAADRGVARAFSEFIERSRFACQPFLNVGSWGKSFIVYVPRS
jgi:hypothetical protein